jgi:hypothetical protein
MALWSELIAVHALALFAAEEELFIDNLLVRIHSTIVIIMWTGHASWSLNSFAQVVEHVTPLAAAVFFFARVGGVTWDAAADRVPVLLVYSCPPHESYLTECIN